MSTWLPILLCAGLFVLLGVLTRDRAPALQVFPDDAPDADACGTCRHPCKEPEQPDA